MALARSQFEMLVESLRTDEQDQQIASLIVAGCTNQEITERLNLGAPFIVRNRLVQIYKKHGMKGVQKRLVLAMMFLREGKI